MTVLLEIAFILYVVLVITAVIAVFIFTPRVMGKLLPDDQHEKQVLFALPIHLFVLILATSSIWKFQSWKDHYLDEQYGVILTDYDYQHFLANNFTELSLADRQLTKTIQQQDEFLRTLRRLSRFSAQKTFLDNLHDQWLNQFERLRNLQGQIADETRKVQLAISTGDTVRSRTSFRTIANVLIERINAELLTTRKSNAIIAGKVIDQIKFAAEILKNNPKAKIQTHVIYTAESYQQMLAYIDNHYPDLYEYYEKSYQVLQNTDKNQQKLENDKGRSVELDKLINRMVREWKHSKAAIQTKMIKMIYAMEIEMIARELGVSAENSRLHELRRLLNNRIPEMYTAILADERRAAESYSDSALSSMLGK
jgi:hypothetical protein